MAHKAEVEDVSLSAHRGQTEVDGTQPTSPLQAAWAGAARNIAKHYHENLFSSRRGIGEFDLPGLFFLWNNNPYEDPAVRERETQRIREWLRSSGGEELGYATYPEAGPVAGYSYGMVIGTDKTVDEVGDQISNIVGETYRALRARDA